MSDNYSEIERAFKAYSNKQSIAETPEPGWFTLKQYANHMGVGESAAHRHISRLRQDGLLETRVFRIKQQSSKVYPVPHYKTCKKKKTDSDA